MVKTFGAKDKIKRKSRSDKGKDRLIYAGREARFHGGFKNNYGKNLEFTEMIRESSRKSVRKHYNKNKESIRIIRIKAIKSNPEKILKERIRKSVRNLFRIYIKTGKIMSSSKYGINYKKIIENLKPFPTDLSKYHVDHKRPLCSFKFVNEDGTQNLEDIKKAFAPDNLQWLTVQENLRKSGKYENGI
jgi:hypothetical protein